jgi:hypothetical protein
MSKLISKLPEDIKAVALQRQREEINDFFDKSTDKLNDAFDWGRTPEKQDIWEYVYYGNYTRFREFHANLKQQETNGWISVEEGLPEDKEFVLAYDRFGEICIASYCGGIWYDCIDDYHSCGDIVTHWQPLPEPPKN